ncbi:hypothetical protein AMTRI_Chr13g83730 [Amborella trichopoda]
MGVEAPKDDTVGKLVVFLAKRDGIDKLVKTMQYVSKLVHWYTHTSSPGLAQRAKGLEVTCSLSRKTFRTGRFLTGFNALRRNQATSPFLRSLSLLANGGEMVYFFFDHMLLFAKAGALGRRFIAPSGYVSAFGEAFGYVFFIILDLIAIREGILAEREIKLVECDEIEKEERLKKIRGDRIVRLMAISANVADFVIAMADIEPNPFCNHTVTLGISGLVSAWSGWYRNWPS